MSYLGIIWRDRWRKPFPSTCTSTLLIILLICPVVIEAGIMQDLMNRAYSLLGYETCEHPNVQNGHSAVKRLRQSLKKELFGQHLANEITLTSIKAHLDDPSPSKALVLSLHGWAGAGKTFTSQKLMDALYHRGLNSTFIRFFQASYHFPDASPSMIPTYQALIRRNLEEVVQNCPRALFVFDEVDKTPPGVLDALVPYVHHPGTILDGRDYKKSVIIFLSNIGATDITKVVKEHWREGRKREELTFKDFEGILSNEAFNANSGLYKSRMIDKVLVDYFVPYLPLERQHVISCIKVAARRHGMPEAILEEESEKIADMLTYWPADLKLYSTSGCKKVDTFVKFRMSELALQRGGMGDGDEGEDGSEEEDDKTEL